MKTYHYFTVLNKKGVRIRKGGLKDFIRAGCFIQNRDCLPSSVVHCGDISTCDLKRAREIARNWIDNK
jgi:S-ribosylhomocysteine lyase LuxS involved in autoinducer biosynthesis